MLVQLVPGRKFRDYRTRRWFPAEPTIVEEHDHFFKKRLLEGDVVAVEPTPEPEPEPPVAHS